MKARGEGRLQKPAAGKRAALPRRLARLLLAASAAGVLLTGCLAEEGIDPSLLPTGWTDVEAIFSGSGCGSCHPPGGNTATVALDYTTLSTGTAVDCTVNGGTLVEPGERLQSCLYLAVTGQGDARDMWRFIGADDRETIGEWIDLGAPGP